MKFLYLFLDLAVISIPMIFTFHKRIQFFTEWKYFFPALITSAILFILWDYYFTLKGIWGFNQAYLTGYYFLNLPLEEILFFLFIPYSCVFTYYVISKNVKQTYSNALIYLTSFISIVLFIIAISHVDKSYTFFSFMPCGLLLMITLLVRPRILKGFFISYLIILIPFLIVNGLLTGYGLASHVVWYNDAENLGIRVLTIPVEDFIYALSLILCNVFLTEIFKNKKDRLENRSLIREVY